jgi:osmoprotectant transport system ATP-binding protein
MHGRSIELQSVSKSFGDRQVLARLDLRFTPGAVTAVIGPSGCGKSTLLRLCNGLEQPEEGRVLVFGDELRPGNLLRIRRRMGYAVQGSGLFPHLNALDNMCLPARMAGWSAQQAEQRLEALLELTRVERALLYSYPHQLSGGQQQRVGLARAMMLQPQVLLLDEPFAAIDPITRMDIHRQLLELLQAEPTTVVLVTHDMREAMHLAEDIVVLQAGRVRTHCTRAELLDQFPGTEPEALLLNLLQQPASP